MYLSLADPVDLAVVVLEDLFAEELRPVLVVRLSVFVYLPLPVPLVAFVLRLETAVSSFPAVSEAVSEAVLEAPALFARCARRFCFLRRVLLCAK